MAILKGDIGALRDGNQSGFRSVRSLIQIDVNRRENDEDDQMSARSGSSFTSKESVTSGLALSNVVDNLMNEWLKTVAISAFLFGT